METQKVMLFRQKNRWGMTVLSIVLCAVLTLPVLMMSLLSPQLVLFIPVLILVLLGYVGPVSAVVCSLVFVGANTRVFGALGGLCASVFLLPVIVASAVTVERKMQFTLGVGISAGVMFVALELIMAILSAAAGTDIVSAMTDMVRESLVFMEELADPFLAALAQMGLFAVPEGVDIAAVRAGQALTPELREQMIRSVVFVLDAGLRYELPALMVTGSFSAGLFGQAVLRRGVLSRGIALPYLPLRTWRLPKGWGRVLGVTLAAFYVGTLVLSNWLGSAFYVFASVFQEIFMIQGIAAVCYLLHKRGKSRIWQSLAFVAGYFLIGAAAVALGIADQAFDFTHRRAELDQHENPYDPFQPRNPQG